MEGKEYVILRYFVFDHLSERLQEISMPFQDLAYKIIHSLPICEETDVALRKLLEAKDAAVRAALPEPQD